MFLLPVVLIVIVLGHAMRLAKRVAEPISELVPLDALGGLAGVTVVAVLVLIFISFVAGLLARTTGGKRMMRWSESTLLGGLPQYQLVKSMAHGLAQVEGAEGVNPVLVSVDGGWQIGYLLESLEDGWVAVFVPQAPTPMSGNAMYVPADRVRPLAISMVQAIAIVKGMGVGSAKVLRGADLRLPAGA